MRVIRNNDTIQVTCSGCGSSLAVEIQDVHFVEMSHHGSPQWCYCACCGHTIDLKFKDLPVHWRSQLFED